MYFKPNIVLKHKVEKCKFLITNKNLKIQNLQSSRFSSSWISSSLSLALEMYVGDQSTPEREHKGATFSTFPRVLTSFSRVSTFQFQKVDPNKINHKTKLIVRALLEFPLMLKSWTQNCYKARDSTVSLWRNSRQDGCYFNRSSTATEVRSVARVCAGVIAAAIDYIGGEVIVL